MPRNTLEFLEYAMSGATITPADIDELRGVPAGTRTDEDLHLDYKDGRILTNRDHARNMIREYVCAFANSDGGVIILGLDATTLDVSPCVPQMGNTDIAEWINDCIGTLSAPLSPPHRIQKVPHPDGLIVAIAVPRTIGLVYCFVNNRRTYYLRRHDETFEAPEYLVNDLLIGRRQEPRLEILNVPTKVHIGSINGMLSREFYFQVGLAIENTNLAWAEDVRFGFIGWSRWIMNEASSLSNQLRSYIDVENVAHPDLYKLVALSQYQIKAGNLGAFDILHQKYIYHFTMPFVHQYKWLDYDWEGTIYLIAKNTRPVWYQITVLPRLELKGELLDTSMHSPQDVRYVQNGGQTLFSVTPVPSGRPRVAISNIRVQNQ
jgi:hypothetical protein